MTRLAYGTPVKFEDVNVSGITDITSEDIECAREFWLDPYLFYHKNTNIDQKRNTMKIFETIKISIENAIRRTLPMKIILNEYLGKEENMSKEFNFDINMNIADLNNIPLLLKKSKEVKSFDTRQTGGYDIFQKNNNTDTNNKILKMIDDQNIKLSESKNTKSFKSTKKTSTSRRKSNSRNSSSTIKKIINESIKKNHTDTNKSLYVNSKIRNNLKKDLADSESLTYNPEKNTDDYQDIFSNSNVKSKGINNNNTINTQEKK